MFVLKWVVRNRAFVHHEDTPISVIYTEITSSMQITTDIITTDILWQHYVRDKSPEILSQLN